MRTVLAPFRALLLGTIAVATLLLPWDAQAITYGFSDAGNVLGNVGAFTVEAPDGRVYPICSGTLIAPSVFLTASHCTVAFQSELEPLGYGAFVSFDNPIPFGALTSGATNLIPVEQVITNPRYNQRQSDSGDIAVLIVPEEETVGITPAALPTYKLLDQLAARNGLKRAAFTAAGYGLQNRVVGGGQPFFTDLNPVPRMYAFSTFNALNGGYLRLSQNPATGNGGTCFGDSGGPNFLKLGTRQVLVAITITGDAVCRAANVDYRLDTLSARQFLAPYVTLP